MVIKREAPEQKKFYDLQIGGIFLNKYNRPHIKIDEIKDLLEDCYNAINLCSGGLEYFEPNETIVEVINYDFVIKQ